MEFVKRIGNVSFRIDDAGFAFRPNFSGSLVKVGNKIINEEGKRNFTLRFDDPASVDELSDFGFYIRHRDSTEDYKALDSLPVQIGRRAKIYTIKHGRKILLAEEDYYELDNLYLNDCKVTLTINGWEYDPGKFSAWLGEMVIFLPDGPLDDILETYTDADRMAVDDNSIDITVDPDNDLPF